MSKSHEIPTSNFKHGLARSAAGTSTIQEVFTGARGSGCFWPWGLTRSTALRIGPCGAEFFHPHAYLTTFTSHTENGAFHC
ncbi:unnamed protein product [Urochloa humidicola]